jgi:peptide-methionine (S)-S-oxide reductase
MEELFREQAGVIDTEVGYSGGANEHPTYENHPGHAEVLRVTYDPEKTTLHNLFDYFFRIHDPTTPNRQGNDVGDSYRSVIFYENDEEKSVAAKMIDEVNRSGRWTSPVVTQVVPRATFWSAEEYHQDYLKKNPGGYTCHYERFGTYENA